MQKLILVLLSRLLTADIQEKGQDDMILQSDRHNLLGARPQMIFFGDSLTVNLTIFRPNFVHMYLQPLAGVRLFSIWLVDIAVREVFKKVHFQGSP